MHQPPATCSQSTSIDAILLIQGSGAAYHKLTTYISRGYQGSVHCNVVSVDEDYGTAEALRSIKDRIEVKDTGFFKASKGINAKRELPLIERFHCCSL